MEKNPKIYMFDKVSSWTMEDWLNSKTIFILRRMPEENRQNWWDKLSKEDKKEILILPNFDETIFEKITGITVSLKDCL